MKTKTKRLLKKALYISAYLTIVYLTTLMNNLIATVAFSGFLTVLLVGFLCREYRYEHANHKQQKQMLKQMQINNASKYYPKGRNFADSTYLEYQKQKAEEEKKHLKP
jgi:hypothetical protein